MYTEITTNEFGQDIAQDISQDLAQDLIEDLGQDLSQIHLSSSPCTSEVWICPCFVFLLFFNAGLNLV